MRRITVLAAAGAVTVAVGVTSFTLGRALTVREPVASVMPAKVAEPQLVTGTIASRPIPVQVQPQASSAPPVAFPPLASPAAFPTLGHATNCRRHAEPGLRESGCARRLSRG